MVPKQLCAVFWLWMCFLLLKNYHDFQADCVLVLDGSMVLTMTRPPHQWLLSCLICPVVSPTQCYVGAVKFLVQETCVKFSCKFLYKKLTNDKKATAHNANNKITNRQQLTNKPTNYISQFWSRDYKFLASNRAQVCLMQDSCTRKNLHKKA